jgi:transmembrane sensor
MDDLSREMQSALGHVKSEWDIDLGASEFGRRRRRRAQIRRTARGATAAMLLVAVGGLVWLRLRPVAPPAIATRAPDPVLHFDDGSTATPTSAESVLRKMDSTSFELERGGARMVARPASGYVIRMHRGPIIIIESRGAVFATSRIEDRVRVAVEDGEVRVGWGVGNQMLVAGASGVFPPDVPAAEERPAPRHVTAKPKAPESSWRNLAQEGDYDKAYEAMHRSGTPSVRDEPEELLLAADVARLSHHPGEALEPLNKIVHDHHSDARAPLAAFTLGRVLLDDLGRPREAAEAFARAESLAPAGALSEDAVAREVEAWSRAGDTGRARARAEDYLKRFPEGRRQRAVRRFGGID